MLLRLPVLRGVDDSPGTALAPAEVDALASDASDLVRLAPPAALAMRTTSTALGSKMNL